MELNVCTETVDSGNKDLKVAVYFALFHLTSVGTGFSDACA